jgi:hypothetical protein
MTAVDGMDDERDGLIASFQAARDALVKWKMERFSTGDVVYIECQEFKGYAVVAICDAIQPDQIACCLENGNIRWYPLASAIIGTTRPGDWPDWIKNRKKPAA